MTASRLRQSIVLAILSAMVVAVSLRSATCQLTPAGIVGYASEGFFGDLEDYLDDLFDSDD
ncbi:MAG TPA: hypothetical protein VMZ31_17145 [Phycisphaerae bacterium]|nr:hypothetical protein [Phycisphaerae bacterium]